jgi:hypothetical protein
MGDAKTVIDWNGKDLPPQLAALPAGRYRVQRIEGPADEPNDEPSTPDKPDPSGPGDAPLPPDPSGPGEA